MAKRYSPEAIADLKPVVEALLFAADEPLSAKQLRVLIEGEKKSKKKKPASVVDGASADGEGSVLPEEVAAAESTEETLGTTGELEALDSDDKGGLDARTIRSIVDGLNADYAASVRAFVIIEIAGGFQFATRKEYGLYVGRLAKDKSRRRLSQAALETLAIIAYRQPLSKPDIEAVRGVNCDEVLSSLMERGLATITGRAETVGRPLLYGTTDDFLRYFGLVSLKDLPRPREIDEMMEARGIIADQMTLELSSEENVAQIEEHLTHYFPSENVEGVESAMTAEEVALIASVVEVEMEGDAVVVEEEVLVLSPTVPDDDDADEEDEDEEEDDEELTGDDLEEELEDEVDDDEDDDNAEEEHK